MEHRGEIARDVSRGENFRDSAKRRLRETGDEVEQKAIAKVRQITGSGTKRRRAQGGNARKIHLIGANIKSKRKPAYSVGQKKAKDKRKKKKKKLENVQTQR